ncbi:MAG: hypothetical protein ACRD6X_21420 [Pyrinomonadaceae bacterium]
MIDVKTGIRKARASEITEFLFNSPRAKKDEIAGIQNLIERTFSSGTNLYTLSISELARVGLVLTGEDGRRDFLANVGKQLNKYNTQPSNRQRWKLLLEEL